MPACSNLFTKPSALNFRIQVPVVRRNQKCIKVSMSAVNENSTPHAIVCGAGIIGTCTAYFLSQKGYAVTVVERLEPACAASGKAGGFLALDWSQGASRQLANASYRIHHELAKELDGENTYGFRKVSTLSLSLRESASRKLIKGTHSAVPAWIDGPASNISTIGNHQNTAQVNPKLFTQKLLETAIQKYGVKLRIGTVQGMQLSAGAGLSSSKVTGVVVDGEIAPADVVVLAMGPWTSRNELLRNITQISGLKANSILLKPKNPELISAHMLFLQYSTKSGKNLEPEVYPRPCGEVYVCGMSEEARVPENPADIHPSEGAPEMLRTVAAGVSSHLANAECVVEQACFLPCSEDGIPVIGQIPDVEGAYVAAGHSCWGILMAPATGRALAELIVEGEAKTVDLSAFSPQRFVVGSRSRRR